MVIIMFRITFSELFYNFNEAFLQPGRTTTKTYIFLILFSGDGGCINNYLGYLNMFTFDLKSHFKRVFYMLIWKTCCNRLQLLK